MAAHRPDDELWEKIASLVDVGDLNVRSNAFDLAMKVVHDGRPSLSPAEESVYRTEVEALLQRHAPLVR